MNRSENQDKLRHGEALGMNLTLPGAQLLMDLHGQHPFLKSSRRPSHAPPYTRFQ